MTSSLRSLFLFPFLLVLALAMTACDSGGSNDSSGNGSTGGDAITSSDAFTLTITDSDGNTIKTLQSFSFFSTLTDTSGSTSYNQFFSDQPSQNLSNSQSLVGSAFRLSDRPATGQYQASSDNETYQNGETFLISFTVSESSGGSTSYLVQSGDVEITRSESSRVEGELSLQADGVTVASDGTTQSEQSVTITGNFQAPSIGSFSN